MFTGLVQAVGRVERVEPSSSGGRGRRVLIRPGGWNHRPDIGDSIAINGCCLTVAAVEADASGPLWAFDAVPETLAKTTLGSLGPGSGVNLEHAVTASTLMGGHFVQGHVEGVGEVLQVQTGEDWRARIQPPPGLMAFMTPKGSVTVEGVSLTVAELEPGDAEGVGGWFEIALIPTTLDKTTLGDLRPGAGVNIETDMVARAAIHWARHYFRPGGPGPAR
jgi:riboflavin synthase